MWNSDDIDCLRRAREALELSQDPSTRIGAVLAGIDYNAKHRIIGVNRLPPGVKRNLATIDREARYRVIVHAEMDVLMTAARAGYATIGSTLYLMARDQATGDYWGSAPCTNCCKHVIAAGIKRVVTVKAGELPARWVADIAVTREWLEEAGIAYEEIPYGTLD